MRSRTSNGQGRSPAGWRSWAWRAATLGSTGASPIVSPLVTLSPSQLFANPIMIAGAIGLVSMIRRPHRGAGSSGSSSSRSPQSAQSQQCFPHCSEVPGWRSLPSWWIRPTSPAPLLMALGTMLCVQLVWTAINTAPAGTITILGSVGEPGTVPRHHWRGSGLRANNDGLLLDSLHGRRAWFAASVSLLWLAAMQATRLLVSHGPPPLRRGPTRSPGG